MAGDRSQNVAQLRQQESASLDYELLAKERHSLVDDFAQYNIALSLFARVTNGKLDVVVQGVQDSFAYTIH